MQKSIKVLYISYDGMTDSLGQSQVIPYLQELQKKDVEIHINEFGLSSHGDRRFVDKHPQLEYRNSEVSGLLSNLRLKPCNFIADTLVSINV